MSAPTVTTGRIKWYNVENGYGFLIAEGHDKDVFLHVKKLRNSGITGNPVEGEVYEFNVESGPKGLFATNLVKKSSGTVVQQDTSNANQGAVA